MPPVLAAVVERPVVEWEEEVERLEDAEAAVCEVLEVEEAARLEDAVEAAWEVLEGEEAARLAGEVEAAWEVLEEAARLAGEVGAAVGRLLGLPAVAAQQVGLLLFGRPSQ